MRSGLVAAPRRAVWRVQSVQSTIVLRRCLSIVWPCDGPLLVGATDGGWGTKAGSQTVGPSTI
jgi:hypothetical protein